MAGRSRDDDGFLSRWAERKQAARRPENVDEPPAEETAAAKMRDDGDTVAALQPGEAPPPTDQEAFDPKDLPDIETLDKDSDFSIFMNDKVPEALRRRALRRLWQVDPLFGFRDGMNDYDEDYTDAAMVVEGMKTLYKVGKGMWTAEDEAAENEAAENEAGEAAAGKDAGEAGSEAEQPQLAQGDEEAMPDAGPPPEVVSSEQGQDAFRPADMAAQPSEKLSDKTDSLARSENDEGAAAVDGAPSETIRRRSGSALKRRWGDQTS
ncbi:DUF3306 domain-containing protein [Pelagibius litoralis]|nr:DUF3306 domain-containing protein [Pelagibius litoralis]